MQQHGPVSRIYPTVMRPCWAVWRRSFVSGWGEVIFTMHKAAGECAYRLLKTLFGSPTGHVIFAIAFVTAGSSKK